MRRKANENRKTSLFPFTEKTSKPTYPEDEAGDLVERPVRRRVGGEGALFGESGVEVKRKVGRGEKQREKKLVNPQLLFQLHESDRFSSFCPYRSDRRQPSSWWSERSGAKIGIPGMRGRRRRRRCRARRASRHRRRRRQRRRNRQRLWRCRARRSAAASAFDTARRRGEAGHARHVRWCGSASLSPEEKS